MEQDWLASRRKTMAVVTRAVTAEPQSPARIYGSHKPMIDQANEAYVSWFEKEWGEPPTATLAQGGGYVKTQEEFDSDEYFAEQLLADRGLSGGHTMRNPSYDAKVFRDTSYREAAEQIDPSILEFDIAKENVLIDTFVGDYVPGNGYEQTDCMLSVYGMQVMAIADDFDEDDVFDLRGARRAITDVTGNRNHGSIAYDLSSLATGLHAVNPDKTVRHVVSIGAGLPEIQERIIEPILGIHDDAQFGIGLVTQSTFDFSKNHAYGVSGAHDGMPLLSDPRFGADLMINHPEDFKNRWFRANMQAVVTIVAD